MDAVNFVDLTAMAKELGTTEGVVRARILSGKLPCFVFANCHAYAEQDDWLPPHDPERFPIVQWVDYGSPVLYENKLERGGSMPYRRPHYDLYGFVQLDEVFASQILTRGKVESDYAPVWVVDDSLDLVCGLRLRFKASKEWVPVNNDEYVDGGYWLEKPAELTVTNLFFHTKEDDSQKALSSRKEQSYLGVIAAMRALLRDDDGGAFPSDAKIIGILEDRFKSVQGVSKRKLEGIFADAKRTVGDLLQDHRK